MINNFSSIQEREAHKNAKPFFIHLKSIEKELKGIRKSISSSDTGVIFKGQPASNSKVQYSFVSGVKKLAGHVSEIASKQTSKFNKLLDSFTKQREVERKRIEAMTIGVMSKWERFQHNFWANSPILVELNFYAKLMGKALVNIDSVFGLFKASTKYSAWQNEYKIDKMSPLLSIVSINQAIHKKLWFFTERKFPDFTEKLLDALNKGKSPGEGLSSKEDILNNKLFGNINEKIQTLYYRTYQSFQKQKADLQKRKAEEEGVSFLKHTLRGITDYLGKLGKAGLNIVSLKSYNAVITPGRWLLEKILPESELLDAVRGLEKYGLIGAVVKWGIMEPIRKVLSKGSLFDTFKLWKARKSEDYLLSKQIDEYEKLKKQQDKEELIIQKMLEKEVKKAQAKHKSLSAKQLIKDKEKFYKTLEDLGPNLNGAQLGYLLKKYAYTFEDEKEIRKEYKKVFELYAETSDSELNLYKKIFSNKGLGTLFNRFYLKNITSELKSLMDLVTSKGIRIDTTGYETKINIPSLPVSLVKDETAKDKKDTLLSALELLFEKYLSYHRVFNVMTSSAQKPTKMSPSTKRNLRVAFGNKFLPNYELPFSEKYNEDVNTKVNKFFNEYKKKNIKGDISQELSFDLNENAIKNAIRAIIQHPENVDISKANLPSSIAHHTSLVNFVLSQLGADFHENKSLFGPSLGNKQAPNIKKIKGFSGIYSVFNNLIKDPVIKKSLDKFFKSNAEIQRPYDKNKTLKNYVNVIKKLANANDAHVAKEILDDLLKIGRLDETIINAFANAVQSTNTISNTTKTKILEYIKSIKKSKIFDNNNLRNYLNASATGQLNNPSNFYNASDKQYSNVIDIFSKSVEMSSKLPSKIEEELERQIILLKSHQKIKEANFLERIKKYGADRVKRALKSIKLKLREEENLEDLKSKKSKILSSIEGNKEKKINKIVYNFIKNYKGIDRKALDGALEAVGINPGSDRYDEMVTVFQDRVSDNIKNLPISKSQKFYNKYVAKPVDYTIKKAKDVFNDLYTKAKTSSAAKSLTELKKEYDFVGFKSFTKHLLNLAKEKTKAKIKTEIKNLSLATDNKIKYINDLYETYGMRDATHILAFSAKEKAKTKIKDIANATKNIVLTPVKFPRIVQSAKDKTKEGLKAGASSVAAVSKKLIKTLNDNIKKGFGSVTKKLDTGMKSFLASALFNRKKATSMLSFKTLLALGSIPVLGDLMGIATELLWNGNFTISGIAKTFAKQFFLGDNKGGVWNGIKMAIKYGLGGLATSGLLGGVLGSVLGFQMGMTGRKELLKEGISGVVGKTFSKLPKVLKVGMGAFMGLKAGIMFGGPISALFGMTLGAAVAQGGFTWKSLLRGLFTSGLPSNTPASMITLMNTLKWTFIGAKKGVYGAVAGFMFGMGLSAGEVINNSILNAENARNDLRIQGSNEKKQLIKLIKDKKIIKDYIKFRTGQIELTNKMLNDVLLDTAKSDKSSKKLTLEIKNRLLAKNIVKFDYRGYFNKALKQFMNDKLSFVQFRSVVMKLLPNDDEREKILTAAESYANSWKWTRLFKNSTTTLLESSYKHHNFNKKVSLRNKFIVRMTAAPKNIRAIKDDEKRVALTNRYYGLWNKINVTQEILYRLGKNKTFNLSSLGKVSTSIKKIIQEEESLIANKYVEPHEFDYVNRRFEKALILYQMKYNESYELQRRHKSNRSIATLQRLKRMFILKKMQNLSKVVKSSKVDKELKFASQINVNSILKTLDFSDKTTLKYLTTIGVFGSVQAAKAFSDKWKTVKNKSALLSTLFKHGVEETFGKAKTMIEKGMKTSLKKAEEKLGIKHNEHESMGASIMNVFKEALASMFPSFANSLSHIKDADIIKRITLGYVTVQPDGSYKSILGEVFSKARIKTLIDKINPDASKYAKKFLNKFHELENKVLPVVMPGNYSVSKKQKEQEEKEKKKEKIKQNEEKQKENKQKEDLTNALKDVAKQNNITNVTTSSNDDNSSTVTTNYPSGGVVREPAYMHLYRADSQHSYNNATII